MTRGEFEQAAYLGEELAALAAEDAASDEEPADDEGDEE